MTNISDEGSNVLPFPIQGMVARDRSVNDSDAVSIDPTIGYKCNGLLKAHFKHVNTGLEYLLNSYPVLFIKEIKRLRGYFSEPELNIILLCMQDTVLAPSHAGLILYYELKALQNLGYVENMDIDLGKVEWQDFWLRLEKLGPFQISVLEIWAHGFWYGPSKKTRTINSAFWRTHRSRLLL